MSQCRRPKAVLCAFLLRVWENTSAHKRSPFYDMGSAEDLELKGLRCRGGFIVTEYIEREAVRNAILGEHPDLHYPSWYANIIDSIPVADVAPVVHGRWDESGRYTFPSGSTAVRCTECGCALTVSEFRLNNWNYCPVCGAKMDGGASE